MSRAVEDSYDIYIEKQKVQIKGAAKALCFGPILCLSWPGNNVNKRA